MKAEQERKETVEAGRSIGGRTAELATLLERAWETGFFASRVAPAHDAHEIDEDDVDVDADCEDEQDLASQDEAEIRALLTATLAYRRIFPSRLPACHGAVVLSPPPSPPSPTPSSATLSPFSLSTPASPSSSPARKTAQLHAALRTALGSPAFESGADGRLEDQLLGAALEDARDRVEDMLFEYERACWRGRASD